VCEHVGPSGPGDLPKQPQLLRPRMLKRPSSWYFSVVRDLCGDNQLTPAPKTCLQSAQRVGAPSRRAYIRGVGPPVAPRSNKDATDTPTTGATTRDTYFVRASRWGFSSFVFKRPRRPLPQRASNRTRRAPRSHPQLAVGTPVGARHGRANSRAGWSYRNLHRRYPH